MLFDNSVEYMYTRCLKKLYTTLYIYMMSKKYILSDNMCLVHISAIVMLTVMCADRMYMQS